LLGGKLYKLIALFAVSYYQEKGFGRKFATCPLRAKNEANLFG
jgi:hypothetical protein